MSLYRRSGFYATVAALLICVGVAAMGSAFQRRSPHKLRATGLIEVTRDSRGKASAVLTPITILDNGRFQDASIYKSRPRPMAVEEGIVYEAQKSGVPMGYVTLDNAELKNHTWLAAGSWQPAPQPSEKPPAAKSAPTPLPSGGNSSSGDDRPILRRGSNQPDPTPDTPPASPQAAPPLAPAPEPEPDQQDPDRPVLRRRKPATEPAPAATPTPSATTTAPRAARPAPPTPLANTPGTQVLVGVSDAEPTETRSYEFNWRPQEKEQVEAKMRKLALDQLPGAKTQINQPALTNVVIRSFDVDLTNDAVVVLTAEVPGGYLAIEPQTKSPPRTGQKRRTATASRPTPPAAGEDAPAKFVSRFITVIARIDIEGNPRKLSASVTDSSRLDVAPRLELIDAVDVDGDGLAELLFREYSFDQKSFVVYGIGHGAVTRVFEGASQPLR